MSGDDWPDEWRYFHPPGDEKRRRLDESLAALANRRRRDLVYLLSSVDVTDLDTLALKLAAEREGVSRDDVSSDTLEQVKITLVHSHLPKLTEIGAVEFDQRSGAIRSRSLPPVVERFVDVCTDIEVDD